MSFNQSPTAQLPSLPSARPSAVSLPSSIPTPPTSSPVDLPTVSLPSSIPTPPTLSPVGLPTVSLPTTATCPSMATLPTASRSPVIPVPLSGSQRRSRASLSMPRTAAAPSPLPTSRPFLAPAVQQMEMQFNEVKSAVEKNLKILEDMFVPETELGQLYRQGRMLDEFMHTVENLPPGTVAQFGDLVLDKNNVYSLLSEWREKFDRLME